MKQFPVGLIQHMGGVVSTRSVKLLDQINNPEEPETRDAWWTELRKEIRSHCRALACNAVLGYCESAQIWYDIENVSRFLLMSLFIATKWLFYLQAELQLH